MSAVIGSRATIAHKPELGAGTVRFVGPCTFAEGNWVGFELDAELGANDGSVGGETYFECEPKRGIFVRAASLLPTPPTPKRTNKRRTPSKAKNYPTGFAAASDLVSNGSRANGSTSDCRTFRPSFSGVMAFWAAIPTTM